MKRQTRSSARARVVALFSDSSDEQPSPESPSDTNMMEIPDEPTNSSNEQSTSASSFGGTNNSVNVEENPPVTQADLITQATIHNSLLRMFEAGSVTITSEVPFQQLKDQVQQLEKRVEKAFRKIKRKIEDSQIVLLRNIKRSRGLESSSSSTATVSSSSCSPSPPRHQAE